jgi:hypothetical protein
MRILVRKLALLSLLLPFVGLVAAPSAQAGVLGYPDIDNARFLVDVPDDWSVEPGEADGDFVHVNSPDGVYLAFRTIPASWADVTGAMEDSVKFVNENYQDVELGETVEAAQAGLKGAYIDGIGKDSEGTPVIIRMAWIRLDGFVGEIWFAAFADDKAGIAAAGEALSSFRAP